MLINFLSRYYSEDDGKPQGGDANGKVRASDVLDQYGRDVVKMADKVADLLTDNNQLRKQRTDLREEITTLKAKVAPEGARILTADEAADYAAYAALGNPDAVKQALDANGEATAELARLKRAEKLRTAAEAAGYKPSVLTTLAGDLDIQTEAKDGATLVYVVKDNEKTALADYAKTNWADFLPALEAKPASSSLAPDINAGARGNGNTPLITDDDRAAAKRRYSATF